MRLRELMDELDNSLFECDGTGEMEVIRRCHQVMNERIEELENKIKFLQQINVLKSWRLR